MADDRLADPRQPERVALLACSDFVRSGWVHRETTVITRHHICDACVAEILKGGAKKWSA
jgi:hypothetical protein